MINGKKYISINTDASLDTRTGKGYYAYWIKSDERTIKNAGELKEKPSDSIQAEAMAIVNAIHHATRYRDIYTCDFVIINTDCLGAIHVFTNQKHNIKKKYLRARKQYLELIEGIRGRIELRHVPGHSNGDTPKQWINNWCDSEVTRLRKGIAEERWQGLSKRV